MTAARRSLWSEHGALWRSAATDLWRNRVVLLLATILLWVPWRIAIPLVDQAWRFREKAGFPLDWLADAFYEPLYAGAVLTVLSRPGVASLARVLLRGLWLMPRLFLIDFKVAIWGLAAPYLVLHLGSAVFLTCFPTPAVARGLIVATLLSTAWMFVVILRYFAAPAVLVAERDALDRAGPSQADGPANSGPFGSAAVSTGWSLWAARRLTRRHTGQAVLVLVIGQGGLAAAMALVPSGSNVLVQALGGLAMISTAFWWALVWEFSAFCIETRAAPARRT